MLNPTNLFSTKHGIKAMILNFDATPGNIWCNTQPKHHLTLWAKGQTYMQNNKYTIMLSILFKKKKQKKKRTLYLRKIQEIEISNKRNGRNYPLRYIYVFAMLFYHTCIFLQ